MTDPNNDMLDDLFAQARNTAPVVSDDLMARVLADAADAQIMDVIPAQQPGLWARLFDMVGGWPAVSGLAAATIAGVWIGVSPPMAVQDLTAGFAGDTLTVSLFSENDFFDVEGLSDG